MFFSILKKLGFNRTAPSLYDLPNLVDIDQLRFKYRSACLFLMRHIGPDNIGDYLEFGVCHGTSLHCMYDTLKELKLNKARLFGFDSFEGLPFIDLIKEGWRSGGFVNSIEFTTKVLSSKGINWEQTFLIKGWFSETLNKNVIEKHKIKKASLIMIDCDLYYSAKEALNFCAPLIKDTTVIFFDDWGGSHEVEKKAFKEFLTECPQLEAVEYDNYEPHGKVFVVTNRHHGNNIS